ncbi:hypothetical protein MTO96_004794 [Rhipicephalus appendiculatus]
MTNKENYKIADADALFDAVQLYIDSTPPCDQNRLSPRHAVLPRAALSTVQDFVETTIVLRKERNELGISITGGSDTYLEAICVSEVHRDGVAYQDGRLKKGDVILAVNELSLRDVCSTDAVRALREAPSPVRLMVLRENPQTLFTTTEKPSKFITVEMRKASVKDRLGIQLHTKNQPGSIAARHGRRVMQGDQILEINGQNVRESNQKDVAQMIHEWARKKAQQSLRTRTSTWSSYTGNNKEKLQIQRPSLPLSSESYVVSLGNCVTSMLVATSSPSGPASRSREVSPSSSLRRSRLSIVAEDVRPSSGVTRTTSLDDAATPSASGVPSIMVTSC